MQTVTDRYGRKPLDTEVIPDKLDRYGRAVTPVKEKAVEPVVAAPVEIVQDETEVIEV